MKFEVVGKDSVLRVNGEDFREGDMISSLSASQALEFRGMLVPADDEAQSLLFDDTEPSMKGMRDHVKVGMLQERKIKLEEELKRVDAQLAALTSKTQK